MTAAESRVLQTLLEHPYADPYWLGEFLGSRSYTTTALQPLKRRGYAQGFSFSREAIALKRVWTITPEGIKALAKLRGVPSNTLWRAHSYQRGRMAWLVLSMERVTRLRWWMKTLEGFNPSGVGRRNALAIRPLTLASAPMWKWEIVSWHEEIQVVAIIGKSATRVRFTGGAVLSNRENGRGLALLIHLDDANISATAHRENWTRWLKAQKDTPQFDSTRHLILTPLAIVAQNDYRFNEYATMLREIALRHHLILPNIYLALDENIKTTRGNPAQPIWYNINADQNQIFLADERGFVDVQSSPRWHLICPRVRHGTDSVIAPLSVINSTRGELDALAVTALTLSNTDHQLVRLIAAHPLLSAQDISQLTNHYPSQIAVSLVRLVNLGLVEWKIIPTHETLTESAEVETDKRKLQRKRETRFYIITECGERYLAAVDGFATALARYRQVKLWSAEQTLRRAREWTHTRLGNRFFVKLACAARARGWELEWISESESRLYFSLNGKRRAHLPDGRGILHIGDMHIHFVVEIDTTRSNAEKLRNKIARCYASIAARIVPENPDERTTILFVTHSTERLQHVLQIARELESEMDSTGFNLRNVAPILFGQVQMLLNPNETIDRAKWVDMDGEPVYCFPQFELAPQVNDARRTGKVTYKS